MNDIKAEVELDQLLDFDFHQEENFTPSTRKNSSAKPPMEKQALHWRLYFIWRPEWQKAQASSKRRGLPPVDTDFDLTTDPLARSSKTSSNYLDGHKTEVKRTSRTSSNSAETSQIEPKTPNLEQQKISFAATLPEDWCRTWIEDKTRSNLRIDRSKSANGRDLQELKGHASFHKRHQQSTELESDSNKEKPELDQELKNWKIFSKWQRGFEYWSTTKTSLQECYQDQHAGRKTYCWTVLQQV